MEPENPIIDGLAPLAVPLATLSLDPNNARAHPAQNMDALKESLTRFGQRQVVVVQRDGNKVIAGNARVMAARELGWTHIAAVVVDDTDPRAMAYALADNRTAELALWDLEQLCGQLQHLDELNDPSLPVDALGWSTDELDLFLSADWTPAEVDPDMEPVQPNESSKALKLTGEQMLVVQKVLAKVREAEGCAALNDGDALMVALREWMGEA